MCVCAPGSVSPSKEIPLDGLPEEQGGHLRGVPPAESGHEGLPAGGRPCLNDLWCRDWAGGDLITGQVLIQRKLM